MTVTRTQYLVSHQVANAVNGVETTIDIPRPVTTPKEVAYAEGTDHVVREPAIREFEAGHVIIELPATYDIADAFLRKVEIHQILPAVQKGLSGPSSSFAFPAGAPGPIFPNGSPAQTGFVRDVFDADGGNLTALDEDAVTEILGGEMSDASGTTRTYPGLTLRAGEFVRLVIFNNSGADLDTGDRTFRAAYKLGLNQSDTGKP